MSRTRSLPPRRPLLPPQRLGPRPLPFHLMSQASMLLSSRGALSSLRNGSLVWRPQLRQAAENLRQNLDAVDPQAFEKAVEAEAFRRMDGFVRGIEAYRHHPYRRSLSDVPAVWTAGTTRLLDYSQPGCDGPPVLVIPSLINRAYILDLSARRSLMRYLAEKGFRAYLLDWDAPGEQEKSFSLDDYIGGRMTAALDEVIRLAGKPVVVGYCMGGLLALGLGLLRQDDVRGLGLLATPWDFHQPDATQGGMIASLRPWLEDVIKMDGTLPVDLLQVLFSTIDPRGADKKFRSFGGLVQKSAKARDFVALEDWLNDGVALAGPVARECLFGWYAQNSAARGEWLLAGRAVSPADFIKPSLAMIPMKDRIVPPASAMALAQALPNVLIRPLAAGHIGMMTGGRAKTDIYGYLVRWLKRVTRN